MVVFEGAYHSGFNTGYNIAEAINYANFRWLNILQNEPSKCECKNKNQV